MKLRAVSVVGVVFGWCGEWSDSGTVLALLEKASLPNGEKVGSTIIRVRPLNGFLAGGV